MTKKEAIDALADGHTIYKVSFAKDVCKTLGVPFEEKKLVQRWYSDPPGTHKGLTMKVEGDKGVWSLVLSRYVAKHFGVADKAGDYIGKGFQAQAYASEVAKAIDERDNYHPMPTCVEGKKAFDKRTS